MNPLNPVTLAVEYRQVSALIPYARNPRTHDAAQIAQIAAAIVEFGFTNPLLVDGENGIIAGHGRFAAAMRLGLAEVPVIELAYLTPAQKRAYVIADNRLAEGAGWDKALLALELAELSEAGFDLDLAGFSEAEVEALLTEADLNAPQSPEGGDGGGERGSTGEDAGEGEGEGEREHDLPEPPASPVSRPGDLWCLGAHRLLCADAANRDAVSTLMQGERAHLCVTSPPYGNQRAYTTGGINDWDALMRGVFAALPMVPAAQVLVNLGLIHREGEVQPYWDAWIGWMRGQGWRRFAWYVWDQGPGMPGDWSGRLAPSFEFVFHFNRESRQPNKIVPCKYAGQDVHLRADGTSTSMRGKDGEIGGWAHKGRPTQDTRVPDSVIRIGRHKGKIGRDIDHPAVFPVALPQHLIETYTEAGEIVFEPFCGSGSTVIAAQRTERVARAVEIAPEYVDVTIKRFRQHYPEIPVTLFATGDTFEAVAAERLGAVQEAAA